MNKEQIEALIKDGKLASAYMQFADFHKIPASELAGFGDLLIAFARLQALTEAVNLVTNTKSNQRNTINALKRLRDQK